MDPWDPLLPGAGAQRAVLLVQLYMRMGNYSPLSILVADALVLTFTSAGATVEELSSYLGLSVDRVETGIWGIPKEMRCTSADLNLGDIDDDIDSVQKPRSGAKRRRQENAAERTLRHYINYATFLPFAYAHGAHILLALCQLPVPQPSTVAGASGDSLSLNMSPTLRRADCQRGLCCIACRYWMALKDLNATVTRCPVCQGDVLGAALAAVQARLEEKLVNRQPLVVFAPSDQRAASGVPQNGASKESGTARAGALDGGDYLLARDPFLVQQGLFFYFLYSSPFVCVNDGCFVVDSDEVMTNEEYTHRAKHKATVLDQFRLVHRNAASIRVKLVDGIKIDAEKVHESALKVAKRSQLPPWLRSAFHFDSNGEKAAETDVDNVAAALKAPKPVAKQTRGENPDTDIKAQAQFIAREFFDDDYEEVPLRTTEGRTRWCLHPGMSLLLSTPGGKVDACCDNDVDVDANNGSGLTALVDMVRFLSRDGIALSCVLDGVPHSGHDNLVKQLRDVLALATVAAPADAARILAALLLTEFDRATRHRNDVNTFMRGNGVIPHVMEGLLPLFVSAMSDQLALCCIPLEGGAVIPAAGAGTGTEAEAEAGTEAGTEAGAGTGAGTEAGTETGTGAEAGTGAGTGVEAEVLAAAERVAAVAAEAEWPWALRRALRALLDATGSAELCPLQQNMMATIIVLRGVIPALLAVRERLPQADDLSEKERDAVMCRCMLLARLLQKAAHGLLFAGPHETAMASFNAGLPRLTRQWADIFERFRAVDAAPPAAQKVDAAAAAAAARGLRALLATHAARLAHIALVARPLLEPLHWNRVLRLTQRGGPSAAAAPVPAAAAKGKDAAAADDDDGAVYAELVAYAAHAMADADAVTGLYADFCGLCGVAADGSVALHVQGDLLERYIGAFYATPRAAAALARHCPRFTARRRRRRPRDGDALAFLLLLISSTCAATAPSAVHVLAVPGAADLLRDDAWLRDGLRLLPEGLRVHIALVCAAEAAAAAAKLKVCMPLPPVDYLTLRRATAHASPTGEKEKDSKEARLWPTAAMRDVFEVVRTAARPPGGAGLIEQPMRGVAPSAAVNFRVAAVELFAGFDKDLMLHLEVGAGTKNAVSASWFAPSPAQYKQQCAQDCALSRAVLAAATMDTGPAPDALPPVVLGLRFASLESLWRLLLYHLWGTFAQARRATNTPGPIAAMAMAIRAVKKRKCINKDHGGVRRDNNKGASASKGETEEEELHAAAVVLAAMPTAECELIQLLVALCTFVRLIDFEELGGTSDESILEGVRRIILCAEANDEADLRLAHLIAMRGTELLEAAKLPSWEWGLWSLPGLPT